MKASHFFKGLSWLLLLNGVVKPLWILGIDRQLQNEVGHEAYGTYFSLLNLSIVLSFLADAGLTNMMNRQMALGRATGVGSLIRCKMGLSAIYLALLTLVAFLWGVQRWDILFLAGLVQVLSSFLLFYRSLISGCQLFKKDAWLSVGDKLLMIVLCAPLLYGPYGGSLSLSGFLVLQAGCTCLILAAAIVIASPLHAPGGSALSVKEMARQTVPFTILVLLMGMHVRLDAFLLERIHIRGAYEAGVYAASYRLLDAGNMLGYLAASFLVPFAARHLNEKAVLQQVVIRLRKALMLVGVAAFLAAALFGKQLLQLLYPASDAYGARVFTFCMAVLPAYYLIHLYGSLLTARGALRPFISIVLVSVCLNLLLNLLLIPRYGAWGCCVAALVSHYSCGLLCLLVATRTFGMAYKWRRAWRYGIGAGLPGVFCYALGILL